MAGPELFLDSSIRIWVVLPIVFITFLVGVIRHYVTQLLHSDKKVELEQVSDSQVLLRSRILRENGKYLPKQSKRDLEEGRLSLHSATPCHTLWMVLNWSQFHPTTGQQPKHSSKAFAMRKHYFNNAESGFFKKVKRKVIPKNPMTDTSMVTDMMKGNLTNVLPMILIGGWINWAFSGFVTTKVPFPLTLRFKPMLQRGIELLSLDASWVSSASWYFLNVFGLRSMYNLLLGHNNAADQSSIMQDHMTGAAMPVPPDPNKAFKSEWEALEIVNHHWALESVEEELICRDLNFGGMFSRELKTTMF
ncbi:ER membrane protein complex subunit 3 isoform X1 [Paramormyrops kingsleyae]|uniref:ER membrane protein complex subunit 3 isoform X1 n=1 Tax=Paramormyrops kingsleyae TaxID=1676925 RepID=UPI003B97C012